MMLVIPILRVMRAFTLFFAPKNLFSVFIVTPHMYGYITQKCLALAVSVSVICTYGLAYKAK
jgi:hypothetical protein